MAEIAKRNGKTVAQTLLRWGLQHGTSVIPKSSKAEHSQVCKWAIEAIVSSCQQSRSTVHFKPCLSPVPHAAAASAAAGTIISCVKTVCFTLLTAGSYDHVLMI